MRAAVAEGLLQDQSVKPAVPGRAEIAGLRNRACVKPCIGRAVCMGAGTWVLPVCKCKCREQEVRLG